MFGLHLLVGGLLGALLEGQMEGSCVVLGVVVEGWPDGAVLYVFAEWVMLYALRCGVKLTRISSLKYNYGFPTN